MKIKHFFDEYTATYSYIVYDEASREAAIIDPVLNYDPFSGTVTTKSADLIVDFINNNQLKAVWLLETHAHADHLTAAQYLKATIGGTVAIGETINQVCEYWGPVFNTTFSPKQFDRLLVAGELLSLGTISITVIATPGHTPACVSYLIEDAIFVGDALFQPYVGTARADFPGGSPQAIYESVQTILALPDETRVFVGHDYPPAGESPRCETTVGQQHAHNVMINRDTSAAAFVDARTKKDTNKSVPKLLLPAIQFNLRAGSFGDPETNGKQYIKIPIKQA
jgi:glyoxylase-like metal-dependent hydrolase (beta-lactamase superfamily II)